MKALDRVLAAMAALWMRVRRRRKGVSLRPGAPDAPRARVKFADETVGRVWNRHQRRALAAARRGKGGWGWRQLAMREGEALARARARGRERAAMLIHGDFGEAA